LKKSHFIALSILVMNASSALADTSCDMLIQHGINNIAKYQSSDHAVVYKYFTHCGVDHSASSDRTVSNADGSIFGFGSASGNLNIDQKRERVIKFCEGNQEFAQDQQNLFSQSQTLSSEALSSWNQCIAMARKDIQISMSPQGEHSEFVHFEVDSTHDGDLTFLGIKEAGYDCEVSMVSDGGEVDANSQPSIRNSNIQIDCTRQGPEVIEVDGKGKMSFDLGYISVNTSGPALSVSFPEVVEEYYVTPPSAVLSFNAKRCPEGWSEYEPAYGRFIRGIDNGVETTDPAGVRDPGSLQAHNVGAHGHTYRGGGAHGQTSADNGGDRQGLWHGGDSGQGGARGTEANPSGETRPVNVALLFCERR
jgi:hypothetical protein